MQHFGIPSSSRDVDIVDRVQPSSSNGTAAVEQKIDLDTVPTYPEDEADQEVQEHHTPDTEQVPSSPIILDLQIQINHLLTCFGPKIAYYARRCARKGLPVLPLPLSLRYAPAPLQPHPVAETDSQNTTPTPMASPSNFRDALFGSTAPRASRRGAFLRDFGFNVAKYAEVVNKEGLPRVRVVEIARDGPRALGVRRKGRQEDSKGGRAASSASEESR